MHPSRPPLPEAGSPLLLHPRSPLGFRDESGTRPGGPLHLLPAPASSCRAAAPVTARGPSTSQLCGPRPARSNNSHLTAPLCPSSSHRPFSRLTTLIGHLWQTSQLRRFSIGQRLHWPWGPGVGRSARGTKSCRLPGWCNADAACWPGEKLQPVRASSFISCISSSRFGSFIPQILTERPLPSRQCSGR